MRSVYYVHNGSGRRNWEHMFDIYTNQTIEQYVLCNPLECYAMPEGDYAVAQSGDIKKVYVPARIKVTRYGDQAKVMRIMLAKDGPNIWILLVQSERITATRIADPGDLLVI